MIKKSFKPYTGNPVFEGADFYIHKRKRDIGKAAGNAAMSDKDISREFSRQKEQAGEASKTYYKELFLENLDVKDDGLLILNEAFEEDTNSIIQEIDKQLKEKLQSAINKKDLEKLMQYYKDSSEISKDLLLESRKATAAFNQLLQNLADASNLINGPYGKALGAFLVYYKENGRKKMSLSQMGQTLTDAITSFMYLNPIISLEESKIIDVINAIQTLGKNFTVGKTSNQKADIVESNITNVVDSVFQKGFSEVIGSQLNSVAGLAINEELAKIKGSETTQIQKTDLKGYLSKLEGKKAAGKTDILFPNVGVSIDKSEATPQGGNIKINIGISNKFYRSYNFQGGSFDGSKLHFSSASGGSLKEALDSLFETDYQHYLAYNTLFRGASDFPSATIALQDIILTRQITRLFASRGGVQDFSQFVIVNGQVVSVLDLINYALDKNVGLSSSMDKNETQAINLHIKGRKDFYEYKKEKNARIRTPRTNDKINSATIVAYVRVEKLMTAIPTNAQIKK